MKISSAACSLLPLAAMLAGCATATETHLQDGRKGYSIDCSGSAVPLNKCFEKAGEICGAKGYFVYDKNGQVITTAFATSQIVSVGAFNTKGILIACKD